MGAGRARPYGLRNKAHFYGEGGGSLEGGGQRKDGMCLRLYQGNLTPTASGCCKDEGSALAVSSFLVIRVSRSTTQAPADRPASLGSAQLALAGPGHLGPGPPLRTPRCRLPGRLGFLDPLTRAARLSRPGPGEGRRQEAADPAVAEAVARVAQLLRPWRAQRPARPEGPRPRASPRPRPRPPSPPPRPAPARASSSARSWLTAAPRARSRVSPTSESSTPRSPRPSGSRPPR